LKPSFIDSLVAGQIFSRDFGAHAPHMEPEFACVCLPRLAVFKSGVV